MNGISRSDMAIVQGALRLSQDAGTRAERNKQRKRARRERATAEADDEVRTPQGNAGYVGQRTDYDSLESVVERIN